MYVDEKLIAINRLKGKGRKGEERGGEGKRDEEGMV